MGGQGWAYSIVEYCRITGPTCSRRSAVKHLLTYRHKTVNWVTMTTTRDDDAGVVESDYYQLMKSSASAASAFAASSEPDSVGHQQLQTGAR